MRVTPLALPEVCLIEPQVFADARGFFLESWNAARYAEAGIDATFVQDNHSGSVRHVLRGLHYQLRRPQGKLVRVIAGAVFDVAVDIRPGSADFGRWVGAELSAANRHLLWVPPGFAHGFCVLSEQADVLYKCTTHYVPADERAIRWDDPQLAIDWPLAGQAPLLSAKDAAAPTLAAAELPRP